jgi:hypothetical protein
LARNPFICDCNLRWLADYLHKNPIETSGAKCEAPKKMHRRKIESLREEKIKCKLERFALQSERLKINFQFELLSPQALTTSRANTLPIAVLSRSNAPLFATARGRLLTALDAV